MSEELNARTLAREILADLKDDPVTKEEFSKALDYAKDEVTRLLIHGEIEFRSWNELDEAHVALRAEKIGLSVLKKIGMLLVSRVLAHFGLSDVADAFDKALAKKNAELRQKEKERDAARAADGVPEERPIVDAREKTDEEVDMDDIPTHSTEIPADLGDKPTSDKSDIGAD
ncbi:MAG: hypothetical protein ACXADB_05305 [Candidatus Hermodarchaeia archaeon]